MAAVAVFIMLIPLLVMMILVTLVKKYTTTNVTILEIKIDDNNTREPYIPDYVKVMPFHMELRKRRSKSA